MGRPALLSAQIITVLQSLHVLSAPDLLTQLEARGVSVNKTSVYRALEKLSEDGILCKQTLTGQTIVYELRESHHDHLVCERCGSIQKIQCVTDSPTKIEGFEVHHHHTTLFGVCHTCAHAI